MKDGLQKTSQEHENYMRRAITLAKTAEGYTNPNPMVGCVVVKEGRIISEACHERYGEFHAERNALLRCTEDTRGADLYVTLEPCCHEGKTPPCTDIIIEKGIQRVYVGSLDSNPLVAGKGIRVLREHGIEVVTGILEEECLRLNEIFYHYITHRTPFVALKYAMTLDGKIAAYTGDSKWITNEKTREHVQGLRKKYAGIMVGINTVVSDDPMLNCRIASGADPLRIILDAKLSIPVKNNRIVDTADRIKTLVVYNLCHESEVLLQKKEALQKKGVEALGLPATKDADKIDLQALMKLLGEREIDSVLIEGGGEVNASALEAGIVSKVYAYLAPKLIMGRQARTPVGGSGIAKMADALCLQEVNVSQLTEGDILIEGKLASKQEG